LALITVLAATAALSAACSKDATSGIETAKVGVVGGQSALKNESEEAKLVTASTVALMKQMSDGTLRQFCTGTLISRDLVLTASHCAGIRPHSDIRVVFGAALGVANGEANILKLDTFRPNPLYTELTWASEDVAVIKLAKPAPKGFKPVPVLQDSRALPIGEKLLIAGFGRTDQGMGEPTLAPSLQYTYTPLAFFDKRLVVIDQREGTGACAGDSGGPAYAKRGNQLFVIGATRGPHVPARFCDQYGDYTDASQFRTFIEDSAKQLNAEIPEFRAI
jgi:secreted trypsin-like serine protease